MLVAICYTFRCCMQFVSLAVCKICGAVSKSHVYFANLWSIPDLNPNPDLNPSPNSNPSHFADSQIARNTDTWWICLAHQSDVNFLQCHPVKLASELMAKYWSCLTRMHFLMALTLLVSAENEPGSSVCREFTTVSLSRVAIVCLMFNVCDAAQK